jgi:hypothetical protein
VITDPIIIIVKSISLGGRKMDEQQNWDPRPPYGSGPQYGQPNYQQPGPQYGSASQSPGYDFNSVSRTPQYGSGMGYGYQTNSYVDDNGARGFGVASMIIGICSLGLSFLGLGFFGFCFLSLVASIVGLSLGGASLSKFKRTGTTNGKGMAIAGVVMNSINLGLAVFGLLILLLFMGMFMSGGYY